MQIVFALVVGLVVFGIVWYLMRRRSLRLEQNHVNLSRQLRKDIANSQPVEDDLGENDGP